jgi:RimJ/RimL family protein N-acetyltransferase
MIALRWAEPSERDEVQAYLHARMGKVPFERWRNILDCRWTPGEDRYGAVVRRNGELAGFLGIVFADRTIGGMPARTGNITSWFLERDLRRGGLGQEMLALVTAPVNVTYTATSPNVRSGSLLAKVGWQVMEEKRLYWNRSGQPATARIVPLGTLDEAAQAPGLDKGERRLLSDHRGLRASAHLLDAGGAGRCLVVSYVKLKGEDVAHHEVLHCGNRALFSRHVQAYADAVLPEGKAVLSLDSRFVVPGTVAEREEPIAISRYFRPSGLEAADVDFLYSEVLLLDLKLY